MNPPLAYDFTRTRSDEAVWIDACEGYSFCQGPTCCKEDRYAEKLWRESRAEMAVAGDDGPRIPRRRKQSNFWRNLWRWLKSPVSGFFGD